MNNGQCILMPHQSMNTIVDSSRTKSESKISKPFLKWAGGKTQLLPQLSGLIPSNYHKYIEPFVGAGALFFHLNPICGIISDLNEELIIAYKAVQNNVERVIDTLRTFQTTEESYYSIRSLLPESLPIHVRAARLIFLNKTCYNGLYRVNKQGQFNVPYGKRSKVAINFEELRIASKLLQNSTIIHGDYLNVLNKKAMAGDLIFLDPPYSPVSEYSDFKRYTKESFYHDDQILLKNEFDRLVSLGCYVILTNSNSPLILDLYSGYEVRHVETRRLISCNPSTRNGTDIIVLGNIK